MQSEKLWRVVPFPEQIAADRSDIRAENWADFNDFLTNQSDGVFMALVNGSSVAGINEGNIIAVDRNLAPAAGDAVVTEDMRVIEFIEGDILGVITCVVVPQAAHKRQRQKET